MLILGQGVPTLNATNSGDTLYEMLRLNMGVPPSEEPDRLGVLAGDLAGFPNGRRLTDDVVDIELRAMADGHGGFLAENFDLPNRDPNNTIGDGCDANDAARSRWRGRSASVSERSGTRGRRWSGWGRCLAARRGHQAVPRWLAQAQGKADTRDLAAPSDGA